MADKFELGIEGVTPITAKNDFKVQNNTKGYTA